MADTVTVSIFMGEPQNPVIAVSRSSTVTIPVSDMEGVMLEAMAMVKRMTEEVKVEALRQAELLREHMVASQEKGGGGGGS